MVRECRLVTTREEYSDASACNRVRRLAVLNLSAPGAAASPGDQENNRGRREGDLMRVIDAIAQDVGVLGVFSDWAAPVSRPGRLLLAIHRCLHEIGGEVVAFPITFQEEP